MKFYWAALVSVSLVPTFATPIFTIGNHPGADEQNVLFKTNQSGTMITGETNKTGTVVDFWSDTDILVANANGQADVTAADGLINNISIGLAEGTGFLDLILNPSVGRKQDSGTTVVTAFTKDGAQGTFTYAGDLGTGQNYLTITTPAGELISKVTITSVGGFDSLKQVRVSGVGGAAVPEPATLALIGAGLLVMPLVRTMRRG